jgi:GDPmannose 4,6-dehydratase
MKHALIFGVTGQDGSYMAELLLQKKYKVYGFIRKSATGNTKNISHLINNSKIFNKSFFLVRGDLHDTFSIENSIKTSKPNEVYNFADQDHVRWSFDIPIYSYQTTANSVITILESIKNLNPKCKYFQPISSNIFGLTKNKTVNEKSKFDPRSIYGLGKISAYYICEYYKNVFNIEARGAIFFNHESPRRSNEYVTQKIIETAINIKNGKEKFLKLGDIKAKIDWGYAKDYVEAAWEIMQLNKSDFYIISTGKTYSVEYFAKTTFKKLGMNYKHYVRVDNNLIRKSKTGTLTGNFTKATKDFNYKPKTNLDKLIDIMIKSKYKE